MEKATENKGITGGAWLINPGNTEDTFTPEEFNEEQIMIRDMCYQFLDAEVHPILDRIDSDEPGLMASILNKAGEQGILAVSVPEEYDGMGKDFVTSSLVAEALGQGYSFSVAVSAHTGIGTLPILYFGTEEQKKKYIPKLASGEFKASYGLTEPGSGSDALGAKTTAKLSEDEKYYILNGQKAWITNGGFADIFTVFAKIDGDKFTAFIIEKGTPGFTQGPDEKKMGIKGSSTVQLYFQDCKVPVENVLGEIGRGHIIAFNILNIGRLKLAAATVGGAKGAITDSIKYAKTREQFNTPIANFGAIKHKLAQMAIETYSDESAVYRTAYWIEKKENELRAAGKPFNESLLGAAEEFAIECAILKVHGSEAVDYVVDEGVQIHGGNGFSDEYNISRAYRDSRINRIFEGTNEINRMLTVDMMLKRAMRGRLDLLGPALAVQKELVGIPDMSTGDGSAFYEEKKIIANLKKAILLIAGAAAQKLQNKLADEQEIVMNIADMAIQTFVGESLLLRVLKNKDGSDEKKQQVIEAIAHVFIHDAADIANKAGKDAINGFAEGDEQKMMLLGLKRFTKTQPFNTKNARRLIADYLIERGQYDL